MIFRNQSESIGINRKMTGNDRKNERITSGLRAKTTENERKRPEDLPSVLLLRGMDSSEIPRFSTYFPRKFPNFPRNSLIFRAYSAKNTPGAESTEGYGYSLSSVVSFFGNIGGILLSTKTTARLITVVTPIAIAALS